MLKVNDPAEKPQPSHFCTIKRDVITPIIGVTLLCAGIIDAFYALAADRFNVAHFLKIIAYLILLTGLILNYTYTHRELKRVNDQLCQEINDRDRIQTNLQASAAQAQIKLEQLEQTLQELQTNQVQLIQSEKMSSLGLEFVIKITDQQ
ncbi:hypothetical protein [Microseira sp. BLCC-F43]|jgi:amino acid permease|uniref:hypothetical protein n=1 Tax=Microseira sp. BLCC-F43 TaxID=3153602 RepID=UPI0035BA1F7A